MPDKKETRKGKTVRNVLARLFGTDMHDYGLVHAHPVWQRQVREEVEALSHSLTADEFCRMARLVDAVAFAVVGADPDVPYCDKSNMVFNAVRGNGPAATAGTPAPV